MTKKSEVSQGTKRIPKRSTKATSEGKPRTTDRKTSRSTRRKAKPAVDTVVDDADYLLRDAPVVTTRTWGQWVVEHTPGTQVNSMVAILTAIVLFILSLSLFVMLALSNSSATLAVSDIEFPEQLVVNEFSDLELDIGNSVSCVFMHDGSKAPQWQYKAGILQVMPREKGVYQLVILAADGREVTAYKAKFDAVDTLPDPDDGEACDDMAKAVTAAVRASIPVSSRGDYCVKLAANFNKAAASYKDWDSAMQGLVESNRDTLGFYSESGAMTEAETVWTECLKDGGSLAVIADKAFEEDGKSDSVCKAVLLSFAKGIEACKEDK